MLQWLLRDMRSLSAQTRLLEVLGWDEDLLKEFSEEIGGLLDDAPPEPDQLLFLLKSRKWECFQKKRMPSNVFGAIKVLFFETQREVEEMMTAPEN
jgi:hypothetical protein